MREQRSTWFAPRTNMTNRMGSPLSLVLPEMVSQCFQNGRVSHPANGWFQKTRCKVFRLYATKELKCPLRIAGQSREVIRHRFQPLEEPQHMFEGDQ